MKQSIFLISVIILIALIVIYSQYSLYKIVSIVSIENNPQFYNFVRVELRGFIVENTGLMFGPKYELVEEDAPLTPPKNFKDANKIALGLKAGPSIDLSKYVSYYFDGKNYTRVGFKPVLVHGTVIYIGEASDAPPFYLDLKDVKIDLD